jgi:hypothetical protein
MAAAISRLCEFHAMVRDPMTRLIFAFDRRPRGGAPVNRRDGARDGQG